MTLGETVLAEGEAAQTNTLRWEDYTQTAIDPSDDCTIWYVGDYLKKDASSYSTKIGALRLRRAANDEGRMPNAEHANAEDGIECDVPAGMPRWACRSGPAQHGNAEAANATW